MLSAAFRASPSERSEGANNIPVHERAMRVWVYMCMCVVHNYGVRVYIIVYMYIHIHVGRRGRRRGGST